jgi:transposase
VVAARLDDSDQYNSISTCEIEIGIHIFGGAGVEWPTHGTSGKVPVIGMLRRGGRIHTAVLADGGYDTLLSILRKRLDAGAVIYADRPAVHVALDALGVPYCGFDRRSPRHGRLAHMGGIENFWSQAERHMRRYNGIPAHHFSLFLKECEWRFNCRNSVWPDSRIGSICRTVPPPSAQYPSSQRKVDEFCRWITTQECACSAII